MRILNLYHTTTGNTLKVAERINQTLQDLGHTLDSVKADKETKIDVLEYDLVFAGSGVYAWLPGKPMQKLFAELRAAYANNGLIKPASPRIQKKAIIYCTYGGVHTGINEAIPAVKYMGQLFDHLGFEILDEWYFIGEYQPEKIREMSLNGRLGNITGRPNETDLQEVEQKVRGIMRV
ncbi:MAG TPA: flavodoxin [Desulfobulbaceae bacterium]|nr:flavodoxin [Desulfobulbaceae bacterium]